MYIPSAVRRQLNAVLLGGFVAGMFFGCGGPKVAPTPATSKEAAAIPGALEGAPGNIAKGGGVPKKGAATTPAKTETK